MLRIGEKTTLLQSPLQSLLGRWNAQCNMRTMLMNMIVATAPRRASKIWYLALIIGFQISRACALPLGPSLCSCSNLWRACVCTS